MQIDLTLFRPPAPPPLREPLGTFEFLRRVRANPLTTWAEEHFEEPIVAGEGVLGRITVVNDPAAIRRIFGERELVELTATIGAYNMVSRFIEALGIDSKDDLSAKEASGRVQP